MQGANCSHLSIPVSIFYVDEDDFVNVAKAKLICSTCRVITQCLEEAMRRNEEGIWGGLTESERHSLKTASYLRGYISRTSQPNTYREPQRPVYVPLSSPSRTSSLQIRIQLVSRTDSA